jgi:hypothetical protein
MAATPAALEQACGLRFTAEEDQNQKLTAEGAETAEERPQGRIALESGPFSIRVHSRKFVAKVNTVHLTSQRENVRHPEGLRTRQRA